MSYDAGLAEILRGDLVGRPGITEKRMFGGLAFLVDGNMLCGVHPKGAMFRVGKANEAAALAVDGARPMDFTGRPMGGFVDVDADLVADDARRGRLMRLALDFAATLPAK
ncbi:MAG: TfoX/Sxy family protein [Maritimibacter sp.]|nr:TfoX/Sxy family protein [Maritimibacter sp.]